MNQVTSLGRKVNLQKLIRAPEKKDIIEAAALIICQRAGIFGMFPFGSVFFGAICSSKIPYLTIPAVLLGCLWGGAPVSKYLLTVLCIWAVNSVIPKKNQNQITGSAICAGSVFLCGIFNAVSDSGFIYGMAMLMGEVLLCAVCYPVFANIKELIAQNEKNEPVSKEYAVCLAIVMLTILWGLNGVVLPFDISIKSVVSIYIVLCITMYSGLTTAVTFALICGFVNFPNSVDSLTTGGMFAICAVFSGLLKYFGHFGAAVGFLTGVTVSVLFLGDIKLLSVSLVDVFVSTAVFAFVPARFHQRIGIFLANTFRPAVQRREFRIKEYIIEELNCFSHTFSEFARQFKNAFQKGTYNNNAEATALFDDVADRLCISCNRFGDCWQKNFNDTYKYMFSILDTTEKTGYCDLHNAPIVFTQRCIQPDLFLNEFNHVYEMRKQELLRSGVRTDDRQLVSNQYREISKIISELSEEIEGNFFFDEQKEKMILSECSKEGLYIRDINVIRNRDGYFEMFFAPGVDADSERIKEIASDIFKIPMRRVYCKNNSIIKLAADNIYRVNVSAFQKKKDDEPVSGDTIIHFETDKNKYYVILCDGMGSGYEASKESRMTAELLGGFLKAGFSKNTALSLINSTLALKMDREGFSTVDLCEIDLRSGNVEFIKVGGAQSYIRQEDKFETVSSIGLPAGILEDISAQNISRKLDSSDMIVMVSDGISEAGYGMMRGEWVKKLMRLEGLSTDELAKSIVNSARKKIYPRTADDMTAAVITLHKIENEEVEEAAG